MSVDFKKFSGSGMTSDSSRLKLISELKKQGIKNNKVLVVNPNNKKTNRKEKALIVSTNKYWELITDLHDLHLPLRIINEKKGMLSYQLICFLHFKHLDLPVITS